MKIMVAIVNYGIKNTEYAKQLIHEYRSMPFEVDIFVLSEAPKDYGNDVTVLVGLPFKDPWSLPFAHKKLFGNNLDKYDVFIYTEDDTLIRKENIMAFLHATERLGEDMLPGFIRYELYPNGEKNYTDIHGQYHWIPGSVDQSGEYTVAQLSNNHSACYILTQGQLRKAIKSGGFLVPPHSGRYDLICTAGTDPYIQCGFTRVICLSHLQDFEIHHLSNAYLNRVGLDEDGYKLQIEALQEVLGQNRSEKELFITEKPLATPAWDKNYYEPCRYDIVRMIPDSVQDILSVGCGWGLTEAHLQENGKQVTAIPLDTVIGRLAEERGISILPPDFEQAFKMLAGKKFDAIIVSDILQHLANPVEIITKLGEVLSMDGVLVGGVPNLSLIRRVCGRLHGKSNKWAQLSVETNNVSLNLTNSSMLKMWLRDSNLYPIELRYETYPTSPLLAKLACHLPGKVASSNIVFAAKKTNICDIKTC
jgi:2-polyprenyl-3-methyl-5-hydroxy-6-metoxy-1,4-benzoquinol methylase